MTGSAGQKRVPTPYFTEQLFPLPSLSEQHRIVAKIDQLMAKCDELEVLRKAREEKRRTVHAAAIKQLLDTTSSFPRRRESSSSKELDLHSPSAREQAYGGDGVSTHGWNFIQQHFGELYTVKENVAELRKTILQLAVMGRLVPQDPNDPPASELLKQIEAEKQRLHASSSPRRRGSSGLKDLDSRFRGNDGIKSKSLPPIKPEEVPYELPQGWEWIRLENVISFMDAGWSPKCENEPAKENEWGVLKTTAVQSLLFLPHENKALPAKLAPRPDAQVEENDILITRAGPKNRVGICCVAKAVRSQLMLSDKIIRFKIYGGLIFADYCALALNIGYGSDQIEKMKSGMADSQMNISQDKVKQVIVALPPLSEQNRIVAKIDQLMTLCDRLEQQIDAATGKQTELLNAVMAAV